MKERGEEARQDEKKKKVLDRRGLLGAAGAGAAVTALAPVVADKAEAMAEPPGNDQTRYRETEHVQDFYRVNRY